MSLAKHFERNLYDRIGTFNGFLKREHLEECLEEERMGGGELGELLLKKGYLTEDQLKIILEVRRKKAKKFLRNSKEIEKNEKSFGLIALQKDLITLKDLEAAILEQERLKRLNLQFRLGEILVAMGLLQVEQVLEILSEQGKRILLCQSCDFHYTVLDYRCGAEYTCPKCGDLLKEPLFLDTIAVDGVIDAYRENPQIPTESPEAEPMDCKVEEK